MPVVNLNVTPNPVVPAPPGGTYTNQVLAADRDFLATLGINPATIPTQYIAGGPSFATLLLDNLSFTGAGGSAPGTHSIRFLSTRITLPPTLTGPGLTNAPLSSYLSQATRAAALDNSFRTLLKVHTGIIGTAVGPFTAVTWPFPRGGLHNYITTNNLSAWNLSARQLRADSLIVSNLTALNSISAKNIAAVGMTAINLDVTSHAFISSLDVIKLSAQYGIIDNLTAINVTSDNVTVNNTLLSNNISAANITTDKATINTNLTAYGNIYAKDYFYLDGTRVEGGGTGGDCCTNPEFIDPVEYVNIYNVNYTDRPALTVTQFGDNPVAKFYDVSGHPEKNIKTIVAGGLFDGRPTYSGEGFALALDGEKSLYRWGINSEGSLANGTTAPILTPDYVPALKFKQISTKGKHALAIGSDGKLYAWGYNQDGQLGNGRDATNTVGSPNQLIVTLINGDTDWLHVSAGSRHSAAIKADGGANNLYTWGNNLLGQLGNGTVSTSVKPGVPTPAVVASNIAQVACGGGHTLALDRAGALWAWGNNTQGQLGNASTTTSTAPIQISVGPFRSIAAGNNFSAAINASGMLLTWGENNSGQLGNRTTSNAAIPTVTAFGALTIVQVSCGHQHAAAIDAVGKIYTWGYNQEGELGNGITSISPSPDPQDVSAGKTFTYCSAGINCTYGIDDRGNVWSWGANNTAQLGIPTPAMSPTALETFTGNVSSKNLALIIDGSEETPGFVGIKIEKPNCELTVGGDISATGTIYGNIMSPLIVTDYIVAADSLITRSEIVSAYIQNLITDKGFFNELTAANLTATRAIVEDLTAYNAYIEDLTVEYISARDVFADNLSALMISAHSIMSDKLTATNAVITQNLSVEGTIFGKFAGSITSSEISADSITAKRIYATEHLGVGTSDPAKILSHGVDTQLYVAKNAVVDGNLLVDGFTTQLNTDVNITEALRISNVGTQTCLTVQQSGGLNVAEFYYSDWPFTGVSPQVALVICGNAHPSGLPGLYNAGFVGIKTASPNHELTVVGTISATEDIITDAGLVKASTVSGRDVLGDIGTFKKLNVDALSVKGLTADNATINQNLSVGDTLFAGRIVGPIVSLGTIVQAIRVETDYLSAKEADINVLRTLSSYNVNLSSLNISATNLTAFIANLSTANINIENVNTSNINTANIIDANITDANITDANIGNATISNNLTVLNSITARDIYAEHFHGPFLITTNDLILNNLTATNALITSANISSARIKDAYIDTIHTNFTLTNHVTAKSLLLGNTDRTTLTIRQSGGNDLVSMYFQPWPYHGTSSATIPAFFIKGNGYHNPTNVSDPRDYYNAGYVGILTDDPTQPLTVDGSILSMGSNFIEGCNINARCRVNTPMLSATVGQIENLTTNSIVTDTLRATGDITAESNVRVSGDIFANTIFGNVVGGFTNTGLTILDEVEANKITTKDLIVTEKIAVNSIPQGDSDKWTAAYFTPVTINLVLDGGGDSVTVGAKGYVEIPFNMTVLGWSLYADVPSTLRTAVSVLSSSYASYPAATPIYLNVPTLEPNTVKNTASVLTGWSTNLQAGTVLHFGVSAVPVPGGGVAGPAAKLLTLSLKCRRR